MDSKKNFYKNKINENYLNPIKPDDDRLIDIFSNNLKGNTFQDLQIYIKKYNINPKNYI